MIHFLYNVYNFYIIACTKNTCVFNYFYVNKQFSWEIFCLLKHFLMEQYTHKPYWYAQMHTYFVVANIHFSLVFKKIMYL